jgi:hypothetical protein
MSFDLDLQPESGYIESNEVKEVCKGGKQDQVDSSSNDATSSATCTSHHHLTLQHRHHSTLHR